MAGYEILQGNSDITDLVEKCFPFFENDNILKAKPEKREEIRFRKVQDSHDDDALGKIKLKKIQNIQNVNALTSNQVIEINDSLTIIYGNNGSGKSSYTRLLNNAFNSRGDKALIENVYSDKKGEKISCEFIFNDGNANILRNYPNNNNCVEFSQFAVFDSKSSKTHLDSENNLLFVPSGFDFFNLKIEFINALKRKVEVQTNSLRKLNPFLLHFKSDSLISQKIKELDANTKFSELKQLADFKDTDEKIIADLLSQKSKLNPQSIAKQIADLEKLSKEISLLKDSIATANALFSEISLKSVLDLFLDYQLCVKLVKEEGLEGLKDYKINHLQSNEWKEFIQAGLAYVEILNISNGEDHSHQNQPESCPFCLQTLGEKEKLLIAKYWTLSRSHATVNLEKLKIRLNGQFKQIQSFNVYSFTPNNILYQFFENENFEDCESIFKILNEISNLKSRCIEFFNSKEVDKLPKSSIFVNNVIIEWEEAIALRIKLLIGLNVASETSKLDKELELLNDKKKLCGYLAEIERYLKDLQWIEKAELSKSKLTTNKITSKQGELYSKYITEKYSQLFVEECTILETPKTVEILQRPTKGQTLRSLKIKNHIPSEILSEGEQRSIALADFLTEIQVDDSNMGVIFDDPVTSFDDNRRKIIAKRLVDLSQKRQVIIFTHDIAFFHYLQTLSKQKSIEYTITTIRKVKDNVGIIHPDLPWITQNIKDRIGFLKNDLVRLKKIEDAGNENDFIYSIKAWYGLLREGWERGVEERLLNGVIERFRPSIETQRLNKITINDEILNLIKDGMEASEWVHDASPILNPQIPDCKRAQADFEKFERFSKICKVS